MGGPETLAADDAGSSEGGADQGVEPGEGAVPGDAVVPVDAPVPCGAPSATATDVYVDRASGGAGLGNAACPFHSILEASALSWSPASGKRTIHVAAGAYSELNVIRLADHVVLAGAGPAALHVTGGGVCSGGIGNCVFELEGGAEAFGFTVDANGSNGVVTNASSAKPPLVHHAVVTGSTGATAGILVRGSADVGPQVSCTANAVGLHAIGTGNVHVLAPTAADTNAFSDNQTHGIHMEASAVLAFDGGELARNTVNGIRLAGITSSVQTISGAYVHENGAAGLFVSNAASASVRGSRFEGNRIGLVFTRTTANTLDLGTTAAPGHNVFGTKAGGSRNTVAGVCGYVVPANTTISAVGNLWSACVPTYVSVASCDVVPTSGYLDIIFAPAALAVLPLDTSGCVPPP